ncbi:putative nuclease HARBI1 [Hyperolius riggenbachi]|uniref:putative nuclease HARBI1 n=1 Tax=Hyperolius riggenbachi TaxID=752182 RepID=UPI0035A33577
MEPFELFLIEFLRIQRRRAERRRVVIISPRYFRPRTELDNFNDREVVVRFRLSREVIMQLYSAIEPQLHKIDQRGRPVSGLVKLLCALHFLGKGSFQQVCGEVIGISQATCSRFLTQVVRAICSIAAQHIYMPKERSEWNEVKSKFYRVAGMPNVLGAIDCTHVPLIPPKLKEHIYRNRKSYHSTNIQVVVDSDMVIRNVVTGYPGCVHDAHIYRNCRLFQAFDAGRMPSGWLLGDSGYPCLPWTLTPVLRPTTAAEIAYNKAHTKTRVVVERTFGVLKGRFRAVSHSGGFLHYSPAKVAKIFLACCVLHNLARKAGLELTNEDMVEEDEIPIEMSESETRGNEARRQLINNFFAFL